MIKKAEGEILSQKAYKAIKKAVPEIRDVEAINLTDIDDPNAVLPVNLS